jgi:hypothetical protein
LPAGTSAASVSGSRPHGGEHVGPPGRRRHGDPHAIHHARRQRHRLQHLDVHHHPGPLGEPAQRLRPGEARDPHPRDPAAGEEQDLVAHLLAQALGQPRIEHELVVLAAGLARGQFQEPRRDERLRIDTHRDLADPLLADPQQGGSKEQRHHGPHAGQVHEARHRVGPKTSPAAQRHVDRRHPVHGVGEPPVAGP